MKRMRHRVVLAAFVIALSLQTFTAQATRIIGAYSRIYEGIEYATGTDDTPRLMKAFALRVSLRNPEVALAVTPSNGDLPGETTRHTTPDFLTAFGCKVAVNADFFDMDHSPDTVVIGLLISNGVVVSPAQPAPINSQLTFTANKTANMVTSNTTPTGIWTAVGGYQMILHDGVNTGDTFSAKDDRNHLNRNHPRTAMGLSRDKRYLIMVVVDGRQPGWSEGCSLPELAQWLIDFGSWDGTNMDGGGSSCMVRNVGGRAVVVNRPSDSSPRLVAANLGVYSTECGTTGPDACCMNTNRVDMVTQGNMNRVYLKTWTSSGGWAEPVELGGTTCDSPAIVSRQDGALDVFYRGKDNQLYHKCLADGVWSGWTSLGGSIVSGPDACSRDADHIDVVARGSDNAIKRISWTRGTGWGAWESLGGATSDTPAIVSRDAGRMEVFCRGKDNTLYHSSWVSGTGWSAWASLGGTLASGPAACSRDADHIDVFFRGPGSDLRQMSWSSGTGWNAGQSLGGVLAGRPTACSTDANTMTTFVRGTNDHQFQDKWTSTGAWSGFVDQGAYY